MADMTIGICAAELPQVLAPYLPRLAGWLKGCHLAYLTAADQLMVIFLIVLATLLWTADHAPAVISAWMQRVSDWSWKPILIRQIERMSPEQLRIWFASLPSNERVRVLSTIRIYMMDAGKRIREEYRDLKGLQDLLVQSGVSTKRK